MKFEDFNWLTVEELGALDCNFREPGKQVRDKTANVLSLLLLGFSATPQNIFFPLSSNLFSKSLFNYPQQI